MAHYPLGVGAAVRCHCHCPLLLLLPRRAPPATAATPLQLRPLTSSAGLRTRGRRHAVDPENDGDGGQDDDFLTLNLEDFEGLADEEAEDGEEGPSPWEGAVVYRRDAAAQHIEYATTLERLGLADLSSPHSRARAAAMGIASPRPPRGSAEDTATAATTTPVLVSVDVARRRGRLRLDGILRTVITLGCYRCAEPAAEGIFANFSLLLTEDPVQEPDVIDLGTVYEEDRTKFPSLAGSQDEDDEDIDWDDRLHFPAGEKEIDISKNLRDIIHLEITLDAFCSSTCKGLCLVCGVNLNTGSCSCGSEKDSQAKDAKRPGTLKDLLKPMQRR